MRVLKISVALLSAAALFMLAGCNEKPGSKVLAKVNGIPLTEEDLIFQPKDGHAEQPKKGPKNIDDIINQELLAQQGLRLGLDQDPSFRQKLPDLSRQPAAAKRIELARRVFNAEIAAKIEVTHQEAKDHYQKNVEQIATELHLLMAKFATKAEAEKALDKLKSGADFASIAPAALKVSTTGQPGWDMGYVKWQQIPVDFVAPIYALKPGEVSGLLGNHRTGYQIVKLVEKRKVPEPGFNAASAMVMNRLRDFRLLTAYYEYLDKLRKGANIVTL